MLPVGITYVNRSSDDRLHDQTHLSSVASRFTKWQEIEVFRKKMKEIHTQPSEDVYCRRQVGYINTASGTDSARINCSMR
jgi:hypothetical protein